MTTYRFYKCGCEPDFDSWCKEADKRVWKEREAVQEWALDIPDSDALLVEANSARDWMNKHLAEQDRTGAYTDVEAKDLEPPDDGYDEDPRVVGYPS